MQAQGGFVAGLLWGRHSAPARPPPSLADLAALAVGLATSGHAAAHPTEAAKLQALLRSRAADLLLPGLQHPGRSLAELGRAALQQRHWQPAGVRGPAAASTHHRQPGGPGQNRSGAVAGVLTPGGDTVAGGGSQQPEGLQPDDPSAAAAAAEFLAALVWALEAPSQQHQGEGALLMDAAAAVLAPHTGLLQPRSLLQLLELYAPPPPPLTLPPPSCPPLSGRALPPGPGPHSAGSRKAWVKRCARLASDLKHRAELLGALRDALTAVAQQLSAAEVAHAASCLAGAGQPPQIGLYFVSRGATWPRVVS